MNKKAPVVKLPGDGQSRMGIAGSELTQAFQNNARPSSGLTTNNHELLDWIARLESLVARLGSGSVSGRNTTNVIVPGDNSVTTGLFSVGLTMPGAFSVSSSPLTADGNIGVTLANQTANLLWASPDGSTGAPVFRALALADIPNLLITAAKIANSTITVGKISASGTASSTTFLRGDGSWQTPSSTGSTLSQTTIGPSGTLSSSDDIYILDNTSANATLTLPTPTTVTKKIYYVRALSGSFTPSLAGASGVLIEGVPSFNLQPGAGYLIFPYNSTTWRFIGAYQEGVAGFSNLLTISTATGTTYTAATTDDVVISTNASPITVTLPSAGGFGKRRLFIKRTQSGGVSLVRAGSDTIDGATSFSRGGASAPWSATTLVSNGVSAWLIE